MPLLAIPIVSTYFRFFTWFHSTLFLKWRDKVSFLVQFQNIFLLMTSTLHPPCNCNICRHPKPSLNHIIQKAELKSTWLNFSPQKCVFFLPQFPYSAINSDRNKYYRYSLQTRHTLTLNFLLCCINRFHITFIWQIPLSKAT